MITVHQGYKCLSTDYLTVHFGVRFPLVVPSPKGFAVVLSTLLGPEVQGIKRAGPGVTQLVETTWSWAKFAIVLGPRLGKEQA